MSNVIGAQPAGFSAMEFIARQKRKNPQDQWISLGFAVVVHLALLLAGGMFLIKQAEFGVDQGLSSMEVQLVAAPVEPVLQQVEELPDPVENLEAIQTPVAPKVEQKLQAAPVISSQGAQTDAKPAYLKNPAPRYPIEARRNRWEGIVILEALVGADGLVTRVQLKQSSGHAVLDEAAQKTVKTWQFSPARLGSMKVESSVVVPVRFDLKTQ